MLLLKGRNKFKLVMTSLASRGSHPKELMSFVPKVFEEILTIAPLGKVELPPLSPFQLRSLLTLLLVSPARHLGFMLSVWNV